MAAAAFSVKAITAFSKECIDLGSDLTEVQNVVDVTFGQGASKINAWAKTTASAFGISELSAKQYSGTMGAMLKSMGLTTDASLDMSQKITELAGDLASFYNLDVDDAFTKIRSGISGETEPLKQLGINMSVANLEAYAMSKGITTAFTKMSQADQALLRYNYLLSVTADAQGDFSRTSDSWANQVKVLSLNFDSLKSNIGQLLITALTPLLKQLNVLIEYANKAASAIASLFGGSVETATAGAGAAMSGISDSAVDTASDIMSTGTAAEKAAKKVKNAFAAYDEINTLSKADTDSDSSSDTGSSSSNTIAGSTFDTTQTDKGLTETEKKIEQLKSKLKDFWSGFSSGFAKEKAQIDKLLNQTKNIFAKVWKDIKSLGTPLKNWAETDLLSLFETFAHTVTDIFLGLWDTINLVFGTAWDNLIFPCIEKFVTVGLPIITQFREQGLLTLLSAFNAVKEVFDKVWTEGIIPVMQLFSKVYSDALDIVADKWSKFGKPIFDGMREAIDNVKNIVLNAWNKFIKPCFDSAMQAVTEIWDEHLKPLWDNIADFVGELITAAIDIYNEAIAPICMWLQDKLYPVFVLVFQNIVDFVKPIINGLIDCFNGFVTILKGIVQFIAGVFTGDWKRAWEGIKNIFKGQWQQISSIVKIPINLTLNSIEKMINSILRGFNFFAKAINKIHIKIPDVFGGESWNPYIPTASMVTLPRLYKGGYLKANNPTLAVVGDNKREGEIITPESKIREQVELALQKMGAAVNNGVQNIKLQIELLIKYPDGRTVIKQINEAQIAEGRILLNI